MPRSLSPIERMIDEACGIGPGSKPAPRVMIECPKCGRTKLVPLEFPDPPGTSRIVFPCNKCEQDGAGIYYFNAQGQQINWEGNPL
jgi:hypothetical protein